MVNTSEECAESAALRQQELKRQRKHDRTRRHFTEEAVILFEKNGFAATTVEEIALAADYSNSTFFRLFSDKEDVVFYDFLSRLEELNTIFNRQHCDNAWLSIRNTFIQYAEFWDNDEGDFGIRRLRVIYSEPVLYARFLSKVADWELYLAKLLMKGVDDGPNREIITEVIAGTASTAFRVGLRVKLQGDSRSLAECVETAFDQLEKNSCFFASAIETDG